jgi:hypothetical protein
VTVFALGLQSQLTNNKHYVLAFLNSFLIGIAQIGALQVVKTSSTIDQAAYVLGGPLAILCSMFIFNRYIKRSSCNPK